MFKYFGGNWLVLHQQYGPREVDLHFSGLDQHKPYWEKMNEVRALA